MTVFAIITYFMEHVKKIVFLADTFFTKVSVKNFFPNSFLKLFAP